jgi:Rad3-related DNA helicase
MFRSKIKVGLVVVALSFLNACASGSAIVTGVKRPALDFSQVRLYLEAPEQYETIGIVKASSDAGITEQASQDYAVEELKKQAAKIGANGVILTTTGERTSSIISTNADGSIYTIPVSAQTVSGKAVFVTE